MRELSIKIYMIGIFSFNLLEQNYFDKNGFFQQYCRTTTQNSYTNAVILCVTYFGLAKK